MNGSDWASLRSDHPADHYVRQALDGQRWVNDMEQHWVKDMTSASDDTRGEADVA